MKKLLGYAYEIGAYEVNTYKVLEANEEIIFKIDSWRDFNRKEKIDEYVKALENLGYNAKESYTSDKNLVLKRETNKKR